MISGVVGPRQPVGRGKAQAGAQGDPGSDPCTPLPGRVTGLIISHP